MTTSSTYESLSHSKWDCKYHLVFANAMEILEIQYVDAFASPKVDFDHSLLRESVGDERCALVLDYLKYSNLQDLKENTHRVTGWNIRKEIALLEHELLSGVV